MKIAVPLFGKRVSPHFGASSKILLVDTVGERAVQRAIWDVAERGSLEIARRLAASGVDAVICGGIEREHRQWLASRGVHVVDNQKGDVEDVLARMLGSGALNEVGCSGTLPDDDDAVLRNRLKPA